MYIYVYNDFVSLTKYLERSTRGISPSFARIFGLFHYYDDWRRTTFIQAFLRRTTTSPKPPSSTWRLNVRESKELTVDWPHDPSQYPVAPRLSREQRATFLFFLEQLKATVDNRRWQVSIVFIPDNEEMLANLARPSLGYRDLDQRRIEAMKICVDNWLDCRDLSRYMFERAIAEGKSPYLLKDRHFSLFGNQVLAEHYGSIRNHPKL
jgi:hypothetical protein